MCMYTYIFNMYTDIFNSPLQKCAKSPKNKNKERNKHPNTNKNCNKQPPPTMCEGALNARLLAEAVRHSEKSAKFFKILPYHLVARHFKSTDFLSVPPLDS
jgi:hypothetical protein